MCCECKRGDCARARRSLVVYDKRLQNHTKKKKDEKVVHINTFMRATAAGSLWSTSTPVIIMCPISDYKVIQKNMTDKKVIERR